MEVIHARTVSDALSDALHKLHAQGEVEQSRNGEVLVMPTPVTTVYYNPQQRVLFSPVRNANPFFHLMEALWMLAGRNDLLFPMLFNQRFREYSDDGATIWGAYGWRWRSFFGYDQLDKIVDELRKNPSSRRCVLAMWNSGGDVDAVWQSNGFEMNADLFVATSGGRDVPCNTHAYFDVRGGRLNMTVCNRSNDALWGAYGANAVHFSVLLEYMAARIGVPVGVYRQVSNNLHLYLDIVKRGEILHMADDVARTDHYLSQAYAAHRPKPLVDCSIDVWHDDLYRFINRDGLHNPHGWHSRFFSEVVVPMYKSHELYRNKQYEDALEEAYKITAWDWRVACVQWLERRTKKALKRSDIENTTVTIQGEE